MNIIDFLNKNDIAWFPIELSFNTDKTSKSLSDPKFSELYSSPCYCVNNSPFRPKTNDFENLDKSVIKKRQSLLHLANAIAIDTRNIFQIDIDTHDYDDYFDTIKFNTPYFESLTKKLPHMFIKSNFSPSKNKYDLYNNGVGKIDFLAGLWSWCDKNTIVHNTLVLVKILVFCRTFLISMSSNRVISLNASHFI